MWKQREQDVVGEEEYKRSTDIKNQRFENKDLGKQEKESDKVQTFRE